MKLGHNRDRLNPAGTHIRFIRDRRKIKIATKKPAHNIQKLTTTRVRTNNFLDAIRCTIQFILHGIRCGSSSHYTTTIATTFLTTTHANHCKPYNNVKITRIFTISFSANVKKIVETRTVTTIIYIFQTAHTVPREVRLFNN